MVTEQEYEYYARRRFFEALLAGELTADRAREQARGLDLELMAPQYAMVLFAVEAGADRLRDTLLAHFLKYPEYILLRWGPREYLVVVKGDGSGMEFPMERCVRAVRKGYEAFGVEDWQMAVSPAAEGLEELPGCYETLSRLWAHRYMMGGGHLLTLETVGAPGDDERRLLELDAVRLDPQRLREYLTQAAGKDVPRFVGELLSELGDTLRCDGFCRYLALSTRFEAARFVAERGYSQRDFLSCIPAVLPGGGRVPAQALADHITRILQTAVRFRDGEGETHCRGVLRRAVAYIGIHFAREKLSLNEVAEAVGLSPNYLSALFRQEMDCTFVEYVTARRMELARELLRTTDLRSGEVARAVGYRDPRYFSSLFKKTQGMTPREYRSDRKSADG